MTETLNAAGKEALQEMRDKETRAKEARAPTTKTEMGEGKLGSTDYFGFEPPGFAEAGKKAVEPTYVKKKAGSPVKKMARGGGIESRGKTKGRFV